jgi:hypothetical protein
MALSVTDVTALMDKSEGELLDEIGILTVSTLENDPGAEMLGLGSSSARDLGIAIFNRMHRELHSLICGGSNSDEERAKIKNLLSLDVAGMSLGLSSLLIVHFAVSPPIAAVIALLTVKKFIVPAGEEVCTFWAGYIKWRHLMTPSPGFLAPLN